MEKPEVCDEKRPKRLIPVLIVGAGGHGRVVLDILQMGGMYEAAGFIDADAALAGTSVGGVRVIGGFNLIGKAGHMPGGVEVRHAIVAIGDNRARRSYCEKLAAAGMECVNAIHPAAVVSSATQLGRNVVIGPGAIVNAGAVVRDGALINSGAIVEHECEIGAASHICPGAKLAGRVRVGDEAFIGLGAAVIQCISIGESAIIGAGAVVIADVPAGATVVGVPGRIIKQSHQPDGSD